MKSKTNIAGKYKMKIPQNCILKCSYVMLIPKNKVRKPSIKAEKVQI